MGKERIQNGIKGRGKMNLKKLIMLLTTGLVIIFVYFIWNTNRQKEVARNALPPLQIKGVVQEKEKDRFFIELSEDIEDLKKGATIVVKFSDKILDESNISLSESEIRLYIDSFRKGENIQYFLLWIRLLTMSK